jgi:hypothetical protein
LALLSSEIAGSRMNPLEMIIIAAEKDINPSRFRSSILPSSLGLTIPY